MHWRKSMLNLKEREIADLQWSCCFQWLLNLFHLYYPTHNHKQNIFWTQRDDTVTHTVSHNVKHFNDEKLQSSQNPLITRQDWKFVLTNKNKTSLWMFSWHWLNVIETWNFWKLVILQTISKLRSSIAVIDVDNVLMDESIFPSQNVFRSFNPK